MKRFIFIAIFFFWLLIFPKTSYAATNYSLATTTNWNIRYDGAVASDGVGTIAPQVGDLDGDGKIDLVIPVRSASNASRTSNGSVYVVYGTLLEVIAGTGNTIDLSDTSKYNLRFYGAASSDFFGQSVILGDFDNNGKMDILASAFQADFNSRGGSGSVYLFRDSLLDDYTGTGNNIDIGTASNYNNRYDGATASDFLGSIVLASDLDSSGKVDVLLAASGADFNSRGGSGSEYVIFDTLIDDYTGTGNNIDLATSTNYNLRYDGAAASDGTIAYGTGNLMDQTKPSLILGSAVADNIRSNSGSAWVIYNTLIDDYTGTGNNIDLATSTNYNLRYDGAAANDFMTPAVNGVGNFIDATQGDLVLNAQNAGNNSRSGSGSNYVIYHSLLDDYAGTGNNIDLATASNYNLRYDGAAASDSINATLGDVDSNSLTDLVTISGSTSLGGSWITLDSLLDDYSGTGNNIDLANSANYNLFFAGAAAGDSAIIRNVSDVNGDLKADLLIGAPGADYNSRSASGSLYIFYNFPHTVNVTSFSSTTSQIPVFTGSVSVSSSSITSLSGVQFSMDANDPLGTWTACTVNGSIFSCEPGSNLPFGDHTVYIRAYDTNTSYTAQGNYATFSFNINPGSGGGGSGGGGGSNPNQPPGYAKPITLGPNKGLTGGLISLNGSSVCPGIAAFMTQKTSVNNLYLNPQAVPLSNLLAAKIPYPWQNGLNAYSQIYTLNAASAFNGYPILTTTNPYTLVVCYDPTLLKGLSANNLRIGYFDQAGGTWKQLPGKVFVDQTNQTLAIVTNQLNYFAAVYPNAFKKTKLASKLAPKTIPKNIKVKVKK